MSGVGSLESSATRPVAVGSLSLRRGLVRPNCSACASGVGHSSYALYGGEASIDSHLVPDPVGCRGAAAIQNGRQLQELG